MPILRNAPIKRRLTLSVMFTTGLALLLAGAVFVSYDQVVSRRALADGLATTAKILGDNASAALSFNDAASAEQTLASLRADGRVIGAAVYDRDGKVFGAYRSAGPAGRRFLPPPVEARSHRFGDNVLEVFSPITLAGERAGTVYVRASLDELSERLWRFAIVVVCVLIAASVMALLLSTKLLAPIYGPISHLAAIVAGVAAKRDYSVRAVKQGENELGRLIDGFNEMLSQIQVRDSALEESRGGLERRVEERTRELQVEIAERERTEAALRSSEERYASAFRDASIGMALLSPEGRWLKTNRALSESIGYSEAELVARTFRDITHPDDLESGVEGLRQLLAGEIFSYETEKRYIHKDGHVVWIRLDVSVVRDAAGQARYFVAQSQDISARRRAEADLVTVHKQLLEASRLGGMAEVATDVLHNVGNALNSVNVSSSLMTAMLMKSHMPNFGKAMALMSEHEADLGAFLSGDSRGKSLPGYLVKLAQHLAAEQAETLQELTQMQKSIDHIKDIVSVQQRYASGSGVRELVGVTDLIEDSLRMSDGTCAGNDLEIVREFDAVPEISIEKHKVLQILLNLVCNAKYACADSGRKGMRLTLRVASGDGRIWISVLDNGVGILPENLTRIFNHGFTTRKSGHGFGLHSGALAAREVGGSLSASSAGAGHGATFILELPMQAVKRSA